MNERFFIYTPIGTKTGGTECLYQLCNALQLLGFSAYVLPTIDTKTKTPSKDFDIYNCEIYRGKEFTENDFLIVPEIVTRIPKKFKKIKSTNIVMWWLSVDNSPLAQFNQYEERNFSYKASWKEETEKCEKTVFNRIKNLSKNPRLVFKFIKYENIVARDKLKRKYFKLNSKQIKLEDCLHVAQSQYARMIVGDHFKLMSLNLFDYILQDRKVEQTKVVNASLIKKKSIAYNPSKGYVYLEKIKMELGSNFNFIPISGMTSTQVRNVLQSADLYLDLGHFPGRDKIPREAVLAGCPIFIAKRGAGRNDLDFPLTQKYKVDLEESDAKDVSKSLIEILEKDKEFVIRQQDELLQSVLSDEINFFESANMLAQEILKSRKKIS